MCVCVCPDQESREENPAEAPPALDQWIERTEERERVVGGLRWWWWWWGW